MVQSSYSATTKEPSDNDHERAATRVIAADFALGAVHSRSTRTGIWSYPQGSNAGHGDMYGSRMTQESGHAEQDQTSESAELYGQLAAVPAPRPEPGPAMPIYPNMMYGPREHPQAIAVLVLGIIGVTVVPFIAPVAWVMGGWVLRQIDANPGAYSRRDFVVVGRILGMEGTLLVSLIVLLILYFVLIDPPPSA